MHLSIYPLYIHIVEVDDDYKGPRLDGLITPEFMSDLLKWFKDQKILHKKYAFKILLEVKEIFSSSPSLVDVEIPEVLILG